MRKSNLRATAAWQALALLGAGAIATPAYAQETTAPASSETSPAAEQEAALTEENQQDSDDAIVVTGSRLVRPELDAPSPVTTVDSETFDLTGTVTVETLLNELPQLIPGNTRTSNNQGGEDFSTLDLRGLGPQRTLILVDGERVPASSTTGVVDIGTIPAGLIERVDVVTGGASAVYGSDAMAGVVNFILKDNYEGMEVTAQYGISEHGDAGSFNIQGLLGGNFGDDRGNLTFFTSYYTRDAVGQGDRDITRYQNVVMYDYDTGLYFAPEYLTPQQPVGCVAGVSCDQIIVFPGGSGTPPWGWITNNPAQAFGGPLLDVTTTTRRTPLSGLLPGTFAGANTDCNPATAGVNVNTGNLSFNDQGQLTPRFTADVCNYADRSTGSSRYNFNPVNYLVTPYERWNMALTGRYDISDAIRLKVVANYTDSRQEVALAPTPVTGLVIDPTLNPFIRLGVPGSAPCGIGASCHPDLLAALNTRGFYTGDLTGTTRFTSLDGFRVDNPATTANEALSSCLRTSTGAVRNNTCTFNSAANAPFTMDRRWSETGPRIGVYDTKTATIRGTLSGPLAHGFNWDATLSYGRTDGVATAYGNTARTESLEGLAGCPANSTVGCVPLDIFGPGTLNFEGLIDASNPLSRYIQPGEMVAFSSATTRETRRFDQARAAVNVTGNLVDLPAGPLGIAVGAEVRTDRAKIGVDDRQRRGDMYGFNATQDQSGKLNVKEIYGEMRVPILADLPFVHEFSVEAGARYSDYSSVGGLFNWKLGAQWSPVDWLKIRGIFNKAARAPSVVELYQAGDQGFPSYIDPCRQTAAGPAQGNPTILAICQAQAPAVNFTGFAANNAQVQAFAFGNPSLSEESAKTFTVGAVLTPNLGLGRFSATVDYYDIEIKDLITTIGAQSIINACYNGAAPPALDPQCDNVSRNQVTGQIDFVNTTIRNQGTLKTSGIDAALNFTVPFSDLGIGIGGRLRFQELLSWLDSWDFNGTEFAGTSGGGIGGSIPEWKSTMTVAYDSSDFTAQLRWNWQSDLEDIAWDFDASPDIKGLSYFDLSLRKSIGNNFELTGIVQNLFNQKAEKTVGGVFAEGGMDISYWNPIILGRMFTVQGKVKF